MMTPTMPDCPDRGRYGVMAAARILGVGRKTVYNWVQAGKLLPDGMFEQGTFYFLGSTLKKRWRMKGRYKA